MTGALTTIVVPSVGRPSLRALLEALVAGTRPVDVPVLVVDDRPAGGDLARELADVGVADLRVLHSGGGGPARARNVGWRHARTPWVSFLDDDVVTDPDWLECLHQDLATLPAGVAGSQGRVRVPLPADRRPTDWERVTAGLADAQWITADLTYRRSALSAVGGFDERFPRAFREDADLGLRITATQGAIVRGHRWITHPVRPADDLVSLRVQRGNADDFLMRAVHGPDWRARAGSSRGRRTTHLATAAAGLGAVGLLAARRPAAGAVAAAAWAGLTGRFAWARIAPGPRDRAEVRRMLVTSVAIPFAASWHSVRGAVQHRRAEPWQGPPELVLFDRDGTLVHDVPYNGDPDLVAPVPGAADALERLRRAGVRIGVVSNQSGVGSGRITLDQMHAVNARVTELLGPFETWQCCPHARDEGCDCRKPAPGMVKQACAELGVEPARTVVVGDIGSDLEAARSAGAGGILVPTPQTRAEEVAAADRTAPSLVAAVDELLAGRW